MMIKSVIFICAFLSASFCAQDDSHYSDVSSQQEVDGASGPSESDLGDSLGMNGPDLYPPLAVELYSAFNLVFNNKKTSLKPPQDFSDKNQVDQHQQMAETASRNHGIEEIKRVFRNYSPQICNPKVPDYDHEQCLLLLKEALIEGARVAIEKRAEYQKPITTMYMDFCRNIMFKINGEVVNFDSISQIPSLFRVHLLHVLNLSTKPLNRPPLFPSELGYAYIADGQSESNFFLPVWVATPIPQERLMFRVIASGSGDSLNFNSNLKSIGSPPLLVTATPNGYLVELNLHHSARKMVLGYLLYEIKQLADLKKRQEPIQKIYADFVSMLNDSNVTLSELNRVGSMVPTYPYYCIGSFRNQKGDRTHNGLLFLVDNFQ